ncbi:hypothetical protein PSPHG_CDS_0096 [Pseudomonas phage Psxphi15]
MADLNTPAALEAYYAKEQIRILKVKLADFKECLRTCTIPKRRMWLQARIDELRLAMHERTNMWY